MDLRTRFDVWHLGDCDDNGKDLIMDMVLEWAFSTWFPVLGRQS